MEILQNISYVSESEYKKKLDEYESVEFIVIECYYKDKYGQNNKSLFHFFNTANTTYIQYTFANKIKVAHGNAEFDNEKVEIANFVELFKVKPKRLKVNNFDKVKKLADDYRDYIKSPLGHPFDDNFITQNDENIEEYDICEDIVPDITLENYNQISFETLPVIDESYFDFEKQMREYYKKQNSVNNQSKDKTSSNDFVNAEIPSDIFDTDMTKLFKNMTPEEIKNYKLDDIDFDD